MKESLLCVNFGIIFLIVLCQSFTIICGIDRAQSPFYALPLSINSLSNSLDEDCEKELIELASAWQLTKGKSTLRVCVIDSGVCSTHPDLDSNINTNYDVCYSQDHFSSMYDINGHGTHVSGNYGISISNLHVHYFHYSNTGLRHLVTCSCGYYQLEPHVLVLDNLGIPTCAFCGATPFIGPLESTESNAIETFGNGSVVLDDDTIVLSDTDYCLFASDMTYLSSCLGRVL